MHSVNAKTKLLKKGKSFLTLRNLPGFPGGAEGIGARAHRQLKEVIADYPVGALLTFVDAVKRHDAARTELLVVAEGIHRFSLRRRANDRAVGRDLAVNSSREHGRKGKFVQRTAQRANAIIGVVLEQQLKNRFGVKGGAGVEDKSGQKVEDVAWMEKVKERMERPE